MRVLRTTSDNRKIYYCPGCEFTHSLRVTGDKHPCWSYNGDESKPTFRPSVLVTTDMKSGAEVCHSFVTDGRIQFLNDCTHWLKGHTVDIPKWPYAPGEYGGVVD